MLQGIQRRRRDQVGFADEDLICKTHLSPGLLAIVQLLGRMFGIDQRQDRIEQIALSNLVVHEKRLSHRPWVGKPRGFNHHSVKIELALSLFLRQIGQRRSQILSNGATHTSIAHLNDLLLTLKDQNIIVNVFLAKFIFNHRNFLSVRLRQDTLQQGCFA